MAMPAQSIEELDVIALIVDLPQQGLTCGQVGTIVTVYSPTDFEVEFVDHTGHTFALTTLKADQLLVLHYDPVAA